MLHSLSRTDLRGMCLDNGASQSQVARAHSTTDLVQLGNAMLGQQQHQRQPPQRQPQRNRKGNCNGNPVSDLEAGNVNNGRSEPKCV